MKKYTYLIFAALAGAFNALSECQTFGKYPDSWPLWFQPDGWKNKYIWQPVPLFEYWPFIVVTDAFHFFKFLWVASFSLAVWYAMNRAPKSPGAAVLSFAVFSATFESVYYLIQTVL